MKNFGERLIQQEMIDKFLNLCDEMELSVSERRDKVKEVEYNIDDYEHYDLGTMRKIRTRIDMYTECPNCESEFFHDDLNEEKYCPRCTR